MTTPRDGGGIDVTVVARWLDTRLTTFHPPDREAVLTAVVGQAEVTDQLPGRWAPAGRLPQVSWRRARSRATLVIALGALLALAVAAASLVGAQPQPRQRWGFTPAGTLAQARYDQSATSLGDGRVLFVGGWAGFSAVASAELWDPPTRSFSPAGSLAVGRQRPTAVLVRGGRVLIVGGGSDAFNSGVAPADLWDPATLAFGSAGALADARYGQGGGLLADGRVLIVGGIGGDRRSGERPSLTSAEVWDPDSLSFSAAGTIDGLSERATFTFLRDDGVLIVGGEMGATGDRPSVPTGVAQLWRPGSDAVPAGVLAQPRHDHTATLLPDGDVLILGGYGADGGPLASAELWDHLTSTFSGAGSLPEPSAGHTATPLPDGRVLVLGGSGASGDARPNAYLWDPGTRTFADAGPMVESRQGHTATRLPDGRVLVVGGSLRGDGTELASAELWEPQ